MKPISKMLRLITGLLAVGTIVLTVALAYVAHVEQGGHSKQPEIAELYGKLNPDVVMNPLLYLHPLRNFLFGSALFIGICWPVFFITISLRAKKKVLMVRP